jgi:signal transduction histidine kinase/CheY-like chemotaxis protein
VKSTLQDFADDLPGVLYQFIVLPDNTYLYEFISAKSKALFGLEPDPRTFFPEFIARVPDDERPGLLKSIEDAARHHSAWAYEGHFLRDDGEAVQTRWWRAKSSPRAREDGSIVFTGVLLDVTDERRAIERLEGSEKRYRLLFENMTSAFALHEIICNDAGEPVDYRYLEINPAFERLTGVPVGALLGKTLREVMPSTEDYWIRTFGKVALEGEPLSYENYSRELGRWYDTYVFSPQRGRFAVVFNDVSQRKIVERELQDREALLRNLTENSPGVLLKLRIAPHAPPALLYASRDFAARARGDGPATAASLQEILTRVHEEDRTGVEQLMRFDRLKLLARHAPMPASRSVQFRLRIDDGPWRWFQGAARIDRAEEAFDVYVHVADITDQKDAERLTIEAAVALEASQAKTRFLSRMSHELRTPLNAVLGYTQLLQLDTAHVLEPEQSRRIQIIERSGRLLLALINDILDLSRIEEAGFSLSLEPVKVMEELLSATDLVRPQADKAGIRILIEPPGEDASVLADRIRFGQVIGNLLTNAIKYNRPGGTVTLHCSEDPAQPDFHCVAIIDTGLGMSPAQRAQLFVPFNRLGREATGIEGTGIGMTIVEKLVALMHGRLVIDSEEGVGTTVKLYFPATRPPGGVHEAGPLGKRWRRSTQAESTLRVLYVEDNDVNRLLIQEGLPMKSHVHVRLANSGREAVQAMQAERPDLLLLDMHLGDMTAVELVEALNRADQLRSIPRVLLTADAFLLTSRDLGQLGFLDCLPKPVNIEGLARVIDRAFPGSLRTAGP